MRRSITLATLVLVVAPDLRARAAVTLPALFADHMVVQREMPVPVWGRARAGERVTVELAGQRASTAADRSGRWIVRLGALPAGGPFELLVRGTNRIAIADVLVGEVWVCSGQSNMNFPLARSDGGAEAAAAADLPRIRYFNVGHITADRAMESMAGTWQPLGPETAPRLSAVAFHFAREIHAELGVPIGLVHNSWSGVIIESFLSPEALRSDAAFKPILEDWAARAAADKAKVDAYDVVYEKWRKQADAAIAARQPLPAQPDAPESSPRHQYAPSSVYNGMVAPVAPYGIRGVIWYQGEGNRGRPQQYRKLFPTLIQDWRRLWGQGDFPFLFVQLPGYGRIPTEPVESKTSELREAQAGALALPRTGMAVAIDLGNPADAHPTNKKEVGHRLALVAERQVYGKDVVASGPRFIGMKIEGAALRLRFDARGTLTTAKGGPPRGFAVAGDDGKFAWADARIDGHEVVVSSPAVHRPVAVRYGWGDSPVCNLTNDAGLPAAPFRSDAPAD
jgi:sialate O-acetylesterase